MPVGALGLRLEIPLRLPAAQAGLSLLLGWAGGAESRAWGLGERRVRVGEAWGKGIIWEVGLCAARETLPQGESFYVGQ